MTLNIPTVTLEDLAYFHSKYFNLRAPPSASILSGTPPPNPSFYAAEPEDDLGYYPDGVKRTLTAEQVAMFRHSEIQRLLKQRRQEAAKRKEANEEREDSKKVRLESYVETVQEDPSPTSVSQPANSEASRNQRLQAALWASQKEWPQPTVNMSSDTPRKEVQKVEVKGQEFLWPKIGSECT